MVGGVMSSIGGLIRTTSGIPGSRGATPLSTRAELEMKAASGVIPRWR